MILYADKRIIRRRSGRNITRYRGADIIRIYGDLRQQRVRNC